LKDYDIKSIIKENDDYSVLLAVRENDAERFFIKYPLSEKGRQAINREFHNQKFFNDLAAKEDCGFQFLSVTIEEGFLAFPDVSEKVIWLGELKPESLASRQNEPIENYLDNYFKLQGVMRKVIFDDLSKPLQDDWQERKESVKKNFQKNSDYLLEKGLISGALFAEGVNLFQTYGENWAFQHHDIVPWHIGRQDDGRLLLVDSGWAGWSLKYYDFAYTILQLIGYADRLADAKILAARAKEEYGDDLDFEPIFKAALFYRGMKLAKELQEAGDAAGREKVFEFVKNYH